MHGCRCYFEFSVGNSYCIWIENIEMSTFELIHIMIIDSRDCDLEDVISRPIVSEII